MGGAVLEGLAQVPTEGWDVAMPGRNAASVGFTQSEQQLVSIVLATERGANVEASEADLATAREAQRQELQSALAKVGAQLAWLADGSLCATVKGSGSASDQVGQAARAALLVQKCWPSAAIALATGRGTVEGRRAVGEALDRATRLLQESLRESGDGNRGHIRLDELSSRLLEQHFEIDRRGPLAILRGEEAELDASRPLLGKPTPCVGREAELGNLESALSSCIEDAQARAVVVIAPRV